MAFGGGNFGDGGDDYGGGYGRAARRRSGSSGIPKFAPTDVPSRSGYRETV